MESHAAEGKLKARIRDVVNSVKNVKPFKGSRNTTTKMKADILPKVQAMNYIYVHNNDIYINPRLK